LVDIAAAAYTDSTIELPAGSLVFSVASRVVTEDTLVSTWSIGTAANATLFTTALTDTAGTTNRGMEGGMIYFDTATKVRITGDVSATGDGEVRLEIRYFVVNPPTS